LKNHIDFGTSRMLGFMKQVPMMLFVAKGDKIYLCGNTHGRMQSRSGFFYLKILCKILIHFIG
jgi:hypothetical protein